MIIFMVVDTHDASFETIVNVIIILGDVQWKLNCNWKILVTYIYCKISVVHLEVTPASQATKARLESEEAQKRLKLPKEEDKKLMEEYGIYYGNSHHNVMKKLVFTPNVKEKLQQENIPVGCVPLACWLYPMYLWGWVPTPTDIPTPGGVSTHPWIPSTGGSRDLLPEIPIPRKGHGTRDIHTPPPPWTEKHLVYGRQ